MELVWPSSCINTIYIRKPFYESWSILTTPYCKEMKQEIQVSEVVIKALVL